MTTYTINPYAPYSQVLVATTAGAATRYVYAQGLLLYEERPDGSLRVPHTDLRGSTVALSDGQGTVVGRLAYGPYGEITATSGQTDTPFKFHGAYGVQTDANGLRRIAPWSAIKWTAGRRTLAKEPGRIPKWTENVRKGRCTTTINFQAADLGRTNSAGGL